MFSVATKGYNESELNCICKRTFGTMVFNIMIVNYFTFTSSTDVFLYLNTAAHGGDATIGMLHRRCYVLYNAFPQQCASIITYLSSLTVHFLTYI